MKEEQKFITEANKSEEEKKSRYEWKPKRIYPKEEEFQLDLALVKGNIERDGLSNMYLISAEQDIDGIIEKVKKFLSERTNYSGAMIEIDIPQEETHIKNRELFQVLKKHRKEIEDSDDETVLVLIKGFTTSVNMDVERCAENDRKYKDKGHYTDLSYMRFGHDYDQKVIENRMHESTGYNENKKVPFTKKMFIITHVEPKTIAVQVAYNSQFKEIGRAHV